MNYHLRSTSVQSKHPIFTGDVSLHGIFVDMLMCKNPVVIFERFFQMFVFPSPVFIAILRTGAVPGGIETQLGTNWPQLLLLLSDESIIFLCWCCVSSVRNSHQVESNNKEGLCGGSGDVNSPCSSVPALCRVFPSL